MMKGSQSVSICLAIVSCLSLGAPLLAVSNYTLTDLGTLGGYSEAMGINNRGQVVGYSAIPGSNAQHAFLYSDGVMQDLGTLGGTRSWAYDINDNGQVVGDSYTVGDSVLRPFLYSGGTMKRLGTSTSNGGAGGINAAGQVAGWSVVSGTSHACVFSDAGTQDLGVGTADAINDSGQVMLNSLAPQAFLYSGGTTRNLGTLGTQNMSTLGHGMNNSGQVVGDSWIKAASVSHAFLYSDGVMKDLGTLGGAYSWANEINSSGQIVGCSYIPGGTEHAFVYSNGVMADLNTLISGSGWTLARAQGINDYGQIVGWGYASPGGSERAFLLTPVPEPMTLALLTVGAVAIRRGRIRSEV
jgi:probable HAF family extracellular repeat protein